MEILKFINNTNSTALLIILQVIKLNESKYFVTVKY